MALGVSKLPLSGSLIGSLALLGVLAAVGCGGSSNTGAPPTTGPASTALAPSNEYGPPDDAPITEAPTPPKATGNPLKGIKLWIDPETNAALRANALEKTQPEVAKLFRTEYEMKPALRGERVRGRADTTKAGELGWHATHRLDEYIASFIATHTPGESRH